MTASIWKRRVDIWDTALKSQAALVELRDQGYIDSATCADECTKLYHWAMQETDTPYNHTKENDDENK
jgi:hypothetical protein